MPAAHAARSAGGLVLAVAARWPALATLYPLATLLDYLFAVATKYGHFDLLAAWAVVYLGLTVLAVGGLLAVWLWKRHLGSIVSRCVVDAVRSLWLARVVHTR